MSTDCWKPDFVSSHPGFQDLSRFSFETLSDWPTADWLNSKLEPGLTNAKGKPVSFVAQDDTLPFPELYYEQRALLHGLVATRTNWHDTFNAAIWSDFPRSKVAINALHVEDIERQPDKKRTPQRDALTLLDESGVLLVSDTPELLQLAIDFQWEALFMQHRLLWDSQIKVYIFGHAVYEKLLNPYIGLTAHALPILVDSDFWQLSLKQQQRQLDRRLGGHLHEGLCSSTQVMTPLPLLGIPRWHPDNNNLTFYQNRSYFRDKTRQRLVSVL